MTPTIRVHHADATQFDCDVLVLKYAQARHGLDLAVAGDLQRAGVAEQEISPESGRTKLVGSRGAVAAPEVLFVGVEPMGGFGYREIRVLARQALKSLERWGNAYPHVAITLHGAGFGLDEQEAFVSLVAGLTDAIHDERIPAGLERVSIVERDAGRAKRLSAVLTELLPDGAALRRVDETPELEPTYERLRSAGYESAAKDHVFVAMPYHEEMSDLYHYGIQGAVQAAGYLCERLDLTAFTGDIVERIKERIESATLVVADLTGANPNVYLEVGYAWGQGVPTVLLVDEADNLEFDVRGQRCLTYSSIRQLEERLRSELERL